MAVWAYLLFAFGALPVVVPLAVLSLESDPVRRRVLMVVSAIGSAVSVVLLLAMVRGPMDARIAGNHIAYEIDISHGGQVVFLYVVATCGAILLSSHRGVVIFGIANLLAVVALAWLSTSGLTSLWCAWAAVTSVAISFHLRAGHPATSHRLAQPSRG